MGKKQSKKKTKVNHRIIILFSVIELVILNMHIKVEVSNSYIQTELICWKIFSNREKNG